MAGMYSPCSQSHLLPLLRLKTSSDIKSLTVLTPVLLYLISIPVGLQAASVNIQPPTESGN